MSVLQNSVTKPRYQYIIGKWINIRKLHEKSPKKADDTGEIAHDNEFGVEIIDFLLDALVMAKEKPSAVAKELYDFGSLFFYGGEHENDYNYLDFDEISIFDKINIKNFDKATPKHIETVIKMLELGRKRLLKAQDQSIE